MAATIAYFNDPQSVTARLRETLGYDNNADTVDGTWLAFIADPDGVVVAHNDLGAMGKNIEDLLGPAVHRATEEGIWITAEDNDSAPGLPESMSVWVVDYQGTTLGAGWYRPPTS